MGELGVEGGSVGRVCYPRIPGSLNVVGGGPSKESFVLLCLSLSVT